MNARTAQEQPALFGQPTRPEQTIRPEQPSPNSAATSPRPDLGLTEMLHLSTFDWLRARAERSVNAVISDPPFSGVDFSPEQLERLRTGSGGLWRHAPVMNGSARRPMPRFTTTPPEQKRQFQAFFHLWATLLRPTLVPGAPVLLAANPLMASRLQLALEDAGLEYRGVILRLVRTMRGGDRPKGAEEQYPEVATSPRSGYEPWLLFTEPADGLSTDALFRQYGTGRFGPLAPGWPASTTIPSEVTSQPERHLADHPTIKPQSLLRPLIRMLMPTRRGLLYEPFMGSGSTCAAACAEGVRSVGTEIDEAFYHLARRALPALSAWTPRPLDAMSVSVMDTRWDRETPRDRPSDRPETPNVRVD